MKKLTDYLDKNFINLQEDNMKSHRIMAPQDSTNEALWNSTKDRWSRKAKHRLQVSEAENMIDNTWEKGDIVIYNGTEVTVEIPQGPNNTVGIMLEGSLKMVSNKNLSEAVMGGMQPLNPINRMMQLAGLSVPTVIEASDAVSEESVVEEEIVQEADATNMFQQLVKANYAGEYKNNPGAARLATIGQILVGLNSVVKDMQSKNEIPTEVGPKLDTAVGLGAYLMQTAKKMMLP